MFADCEVRVQMIRCSYSTMGRTTQHRALRHIQGPRLITCSSIMFSMRDFSVWKRRSSTFGYPSQPYRPQTPSNAKQHAKEQSSPFPTFPQSLPLSLHDMFQDPRVLLHVLETYPFLRI